MVKVTAEYDLNIDYTRLLGKGWAGVLRPLLESEYMENLMKFLHGAYQIENVRPHKANVFLPFKATGFHEVKVVIISDEPYNNMKSTGIPFANPDSFGALFSPELLKIQKTIELDCYDGLDMRMSPTLIDWGTQGIFSIPSTFTSVEGKKGKHQIYWRHFTRELLKSLTEYKTGVIYLLWGKEALSFKPYLNDKANYVFYAESPTEAVACNRAWQCDHFEKTNGILSYLNGPECQIVW